MASHAQNCSKGKPGQAHQGPAASPSTAPAQLTRSRKAPWELLEGGGFDRICKMCLCLHARFAHAGKPSRSHLQTDPQDQNYYLGQPTDQTRAQKCHLVEADTALLA